MRKFTIQQGCKAKFLALQFKAVYSICLCTVLGSLTPSCLEISVTCFAWTLCTFENNFGINHEFEFMKYLKESIYIDHYHKNIEQAFEIFRTLKDRI